MATPVKIVLVRGDSRNINVTVSQIVGGVKTRVDLTHAIVTMTWRRAAESPASVLVKDGTLVDALNGMLTMALIPEDTAAITPGSYVFDIRVAIGTDIYTVLGGAIELMPDVTHPDAPTPDFP